MGIGSWARRTALTVLVAGMAAGLAGAAEPVTVRLWEGEAPGAVGKEEADIPTITVYRPAPEKANGAAMVICPGGGYGFLAMDHEGQQVAEWLNSIGITGAVLKYRIAPRYHHPAPMQDVQRAIRLLRARAGEWGIDPRRVGVVGFSAGGHLASTAGTHFDGGKADAADPVERQSCRPDAMVLAYPVITMDAATTHGGSRKNLLGDDPPAELVELMSNDRQVTRDTPPTFVVHTAEDAAVVPQNAFLLVEALRKASVPVEFHLYEQGRHGLGLGSGLPSLNIPPDATFATWPNLCANWFERRGFLKAQP